MNRGRKKPTLNPIAFRPFHKLLDRYTYVTIRYKLADQNTYIQYLNTYPRAWINESWGRVNLELHSNEVVSDAKYENHINKSTLENEIIKAGSSLNEWYIYLCEPFTGDKEDWGNELAIRRARHQIAMQFYSTASVELIKCFDQCNSYKEKHNNNDNKEKIIIAIYILFLLSIPFWSRIKDGFTSVDILTEKIYHESRFGFNGAICRDGWISHSRGRGTCSHHGGVRYYFTKNDHQISREEAREEARKRSWIE